MLDSRLAMVSAPVQASTYPSSPIMLSNSGGTDRSVKKAASAASPRIRYSMHELTVSLISSQAVLRLETFR